MMRSKMNKTIDITILSSNNSKPVNYTAKRTNNGLNIFKDNKFVKWVPKKDPNYKGKIDIIDEFDIEKELMSFTEKELIIPRELSAKEVKELCDKGLEELNYYTYGFDCPDISKLNTKEDKDELFNKILNKFEKQLREWIYD